MLKKEIIETYRNINSIVEYLKKRGQFNDPQIVYVIKNENKIAFGVNDDVLNDPQSYFVELEEDVVLVNELRFKDKSIEETGLRTKNEWALLKKLNNGWNLVYITVSFHFELWDFFNNNVQKLSIVEDGVRKYLDYCRKYGITEKFINANSIVDTKDYFSLYPPYESHDEPSYSYILKKRIDNQELSLSYLGTIDAAEEYRIVFMTDGNISAIKTCTSFDEATKEYLKFYKVMAENGEKAVKEAIGCFSKIRDGKEYGC